MLQKPAVLAELAQRGKGARLSRFGETCSESPSRFTMDAVSARSAHRKRQVSLSGYVRALLYSRSCRFRRATPRRGARHDDDLPFGLLIMWKGALRNHRARRTLTLLPMRAGLDNCNCRTNPRRPRVWRHFDPSLGAFCRGWIVAPFKNCLTRGVASRTLRSMILPSRRRSPGASGYACRERGQALFVLARAAGAAQERPRSTSTRPVLATKLKSRGPNVDDSRRWLSVP
jgi:hypothetical protein